MSRKVLEELNNTYKQRIAMNIGNIIIYLIIVAVSWGIFALFFKENMVVGIIVVIIALVLIRNFNHSISSISVLKSFKGMPILISYYLDNWKNIKGLIQSVENVNEIWKDSLTPLHHLPNLEDENESVDILKLLMQKGANINVKTNLGTPLFYAIQMKKYKLAESMVEFKADVNLTNSDNETCAFNVVRDKQNRLLEILIKNGLDVDVKNINGKTINNLT